MSIVLTSVALTVMFFKASNYRRTYLLIYTINDYLASNIYIASKIPVSYPTLMEEFF